MVGRLVAILVLLSCHLQAEVLFEGYYKITSGGVHVGYTLSRYEYDSTKKQFIGTYFLKTNELGGNITESWKSISSEDLKPISYNYTMLQGTKTKVIDAKVEKSRLVAQVKEGNESKKVINDIPKGAFFSGLLVYAILKSPQGLQANLKYDYTAIAEEDASIEKGFADIKPKEAWNDLQAFRVVNEFKKSKFISYITDKGEMLTAKAPVDGIAYELMPQPSLATANFSIPTSLLRTLYGDIPTGVRNEVAKNFQNKPKTTSTVAPVETKSEAKKQE